MALQINLMPDPELHNLSKILALGKWFSIFVRLMSYGSCQKWKYYRVYIEREHNSNSQSLFCAR